MDDTKSDGDTLEAHSIIASSSPRESKYLLEHLLDLVLSLVSFVEMWLHSYCTSTSVWGFSIIIPLTSCLQLYIRLTYYEKC